MLIIDDLLLWLPLKGLRSVTKQIKKVADREARAKSESYIARVNELKRLRSLFKEGSISQGEYETRARSILKELADK